MKNETVAELKAIQANLISLRRKEQAAYLAFDAACDAQLLANDLTLKTKLAFLRASENLRNFLNDTRD